MGLFSRRTTTEASAVPGGQMVIDSGRRLSTSLPPAELMARVQQLMDSYAPRKYPTLPHTVPAGFTWNGPVDEAPSNVYVANLVNAPHPGDYLVISYRPSGAGTELGVFPQGVGDARLTIPFTGNLKMLDGSLSSIGRIPGGLLRLGAPPIAHDLISRTLETAGYPLTANNLGLVAEQFFVMVQIKANQYLDAAERPNAAGRCADWQARARFGPAGIEPLDMVLQDLAYRAPSTLPWIQDIPIRIQSIMLELAGSAGSFWDQMNRA